MIQIITAVGPNIVDKLFAEVKVDHPVPPTDGEAFGGERMYKIQSTPVVTAATETWEQIHGFLKRISRDGWDAVKADFAGLMDFISARTRELGELAEEYEQLLVEKLHEMMRKASAFLLKSVNLEVEVGKQLYTLTSIELETKVVFSASIEASVATLGKFLGSGTTTITGTYSILGAPTIGENAPQ